LKPDSVAHEHALAVQAIALARLGGRGHGIVASPRVVRVPRVGTAHLLVEFLVAERDFGSFLITVHGSLSYFCNAGGWQQEIRRSMSNLFAEYQPKANCGRSDDSAASASTSLQIREAIPEDVPALARIAHERNGGVLAEHVAGIERALSRRTDPRT